MQVPNKTGWIGVRETVDVKVNSYCLLVMLKR